MVGIGDYAGLNLFVDFLRRVGLSWNRIKMYIQAVLHIEMETVLTNLRQFESLSA